MCLSHLLISMKSTIYEYIIFIIRLALKGKKQKQKKKLHSFLVYPFSQ